MCFSFQSSSFMTYLRVASFSSIGLLSACENNASNPSTVPPSGLAGSDAAKAASAKLGHAKKNAQAAEHKAGEGLLNLPGDTVVAKVNGQDVLQRDFMRSFGQQRRALNMHRGDLPPELLRVFERPAFDQLLKRILLAQEAKKRGLYPDAKRQARLFEEALKAQPDDTRMRTFFKEGSDAKKAFVAELSVDDAISKLVMQEKNKVKVTVKEAKEIFLKKGMNESTVMRIRRILLLPNKQAEETAEQLKKRAEALRQTLLNKGEGAFALAAERENSTRESKEKGGALGWVSKRQMLPVESKTAVEAPIGDVSKVVLSEKGAVLLFKAEVKEQKIKFENIKKKIIATELQARSLEAVNALLTSLRQKSEISVMIPPRQPMAAGSLQGQKHPAIPKNGERPLPSAENVLPGMRNPHEKGHTPNKNRTLALPAHGAQKRVQKSSNKLQLVP